jgi:L-cysteine S-thiosulfotransferase
MRRRARALVALGVAIAAASAAGLAQQRRIALDALRSGIELAGPDVRALQADDFQNPGMLWVERGAQLWRAAPSAGAKPCAGCHDDAARSMRDVAPRYPKFDATLGRVVNLEARINACRTARQGESAWRDESEALLAASAYVAHQSRGLAKRVSIEGPARATFEAGRALYERRMGQMNLACTQCHDQQWGRRLLAETISQGHSNAYPIYRLEWQTVGSLARRFRSCLSGIRAEMWPYGAEEYLQLELYLAWRGAGLPLETPGVRR